MLGFIGSKSCLKKKALQEARSFGLPILALTGGNVKHHIVHGATGYLMDNMEKVLQQLEKLVGQPKLLADLQSYITNHNTGLFYNWEQAGKRFIQHLASH